MEIPKFKDRQQAGELLAQRLGAYAGRNDVMVLALPCGGVPVGAAIAAKLGVPLDVLLVRKFGLPGREEVVMGTIASVGICILQAEVLSALDIPSDVIETVAQREMQEIKQREKLYRDDLPAPQFRERVVILVDDGLTTGSTMQVATHIVREFNPARLIVAVPVAPAAACEKLQAEADEIICLRMPDPFRAVSLWYDNFEEISDDQVKNLLEKACKKQLHRTHPLHVSHRRAGGGGDAIHRT